MDLSAKNELSFLAQIVEALNKATPEVDWLLVGALARDLLLEYAHGIAIARATTDADFAVAVGSWEDFSTIREALLASSDFEPTRVEHRVVFKAETRIDLVPFGGIENSDGTINWPSKGNPTMNVIGFAEALRTSVDVSLPSGQQLKVAGLAMQILLKLVAWQDRRASRPGVDAGDIMLILRSYSECGNLERLINDHSDLMKRADFDYELSGSILAGRDLSSSLSATTGRQEKALKTAQEIVRCQLEGEGPGPLLRDVPGRDMDYFRKLLEAFGDGLTWRP